HTDDLTGLYNRRFFRQCIGELKSQCDENGGSFALLILDVDRFKEINDAYGHAVGDQALISIARVLEREFTGRGFVFRYAGDEFVGMIPQLSEEDARAFCSRILAEVSLIGAQGEDKNPLKSLSVSIGVSLYPQDGTGISELMDLADRALYASKMSGRNSFHTATEMNRRDREEGRKWPPKVVCESLIGREPQWELLHKHFQDCSNARGHLVFVSGEGGIGKSRLLQQYCRRHRASDYHILVGECTEGTTIHSYAPVRDALKKGFEAKDPATVNLYKQLEENCRRELIALVPQFSRFEKSPLTPAQSTDRYFLLESILMLLQTLSRQLPTVLVLEDIHWSDEATLNLLQYLARNVRGEKILLVATFRDEEAIHTELPSIIQNMSRENLFETIQLKPLAVDETGMMVQEIFRGYHLSEDFKQFMFHESEGIPFYVEELIKLLLEEGYVERFGTELELHKPDKMLLPFSIRSLVQRRISRLADAPKRVLDFASIIGYEFDLGILARLIEENEGQLLDLLEQLIKMQLIREVGAEGEEHYAFKHNKIRDVVYEDMGLIKRKKFHRRVGELLEETHPEDLLLYAEELAYHFHQGGEWAKASAYSLQAGKKALQIHDYRSASSFFERCFDFARHLDSYPVDQLVDLYISKGAALEALGSWEEAARCYESLVEIGRENAPSRLHPDALNHLSRVFYKRENFPRSLGLAEQALQLSTESNYEAGICRAHYNLGKNYWRLCEYERALESMKAAIDASGPQQDPGMRAKLLNSAGVICLEQSDFEAALSYFDRALQIFQRIPDKQGVIKSLVNTSIIRHLMGDLNGARQHLLNADKLAQEIGDPFSIGSCSVNLADLECKLGDFELAARLNERAGRIYNELNYDLGLTHYLENESHLFLARGNLEASLESISKALVIARDKKLHRRTIELLKDEAAIHYYLAHYANALNRLADVMRISAGISEGSIQAEVQLKTGFVYAALEDRDAAIGEWAGAVETKSKSHSIAYLFWRAAASGFLASFAGNEQETRAAQNEMKIIGEHTNHSTLIVVARLLSANQFDALGLYSEALATALSADSVASQFGLDLWLIRIRMKIYELQKQMKHSTDPEDVRQLLAAALAQKQNSIVHRCFRLLQQIDPNFGQIAGEWATHWNEWSPNIPESYRNRLKPTLE
ncbi:MAG TPA: diguanylate cyclase, partial [Acidobacteriota bacterium]|nr:diguanylate cyclase [Acidobacteriota bacterium]